MGDRIVKWVEKNVDLSQIDESKLPSAASIDASQQYNHPTDIDPTDELVERMCLHYYKLYGLTIVGLRKHHADVNAELEQSYLDEVHEPSQRLMQYMPCPEDHQETVDLVNDLKKAKVPIYLFSNAHRDHVDRVLEHIGCKSSMFEDCLEYYAMRENCKPNPGAYEMMLAMVRRSHPSAQFEELVFFDDAKTNLEAAKKFGMITVLVHDGHVETKPDYVDFMVNDVRNTKEINVIFESLGIKK